MAFDRSQGKALIRKIDCDDGYDIGTMSQIYIYLLLHISMKPKCREGLKLCIYVPYVRPFSLNGNSTM